MAIVGQAYLLANHLWRSRTSAGYLSRSGLTMDDGREICAAGCFRSVNTAFNCVRNKIARTAVRNAFFLN